MNALLQRILETRRAAIAAARLAVPPTLLQRRAAQRHEHRSLASALRAPGVRIIAEIKRASPSRGRLRGELDPARLAAAYAAGGAAALSVLTEPAFFLGSAGDLRRARAAVSLPVLRKDFIIDAYQLLESAAMGADAVLLIARLLDDATLWQFYEQAAELGLDALVEVHDDDDASRALALGARLVAINNRDLGDFSVDSDRAMRLAARFPTGTCVVAASGIATAADIASAASAGIRRFLIGEALVRAPDPAALLRSLVASGAAT